MLSTYIVSFIWAPWVFPVYPHGFSSIFLQRPIFLSFYSLIPCQWMPKNAIYGWIVFCLTSENPTFEQLDRPFSPLCSPRFKCWDRPKSNSFSSTVSCCSAFYEWHLLPPTSHSSRWGNFSEGWILLSWVDKSDFKILMGHVLMSQWISCKKSKSLCAANIME